MAAQKIQCQVNGETHSVDSGSFVSDLVTQLALDTRKVAIERNGEIVLRSAYSATPITQGDQIEIVQFIGGG